MRKLSIIGALFASLAVGALAVVAVTASAAEEEALWLCASESVPNAKECLSTSENLETLTLEDRVLQAAVVCPPGVVLSEGWVGPGQEDETTAVTFTSNGGCKKAATGLNLKEEEVTNKCGTFESVNAVGLPWTTLLELVGGVLYDTILPGSGGAGYADKCTGVTDTCVTVEKFEPLVLVVNLAELEGSLLLVTVIFPPKASELLQGEKEFAKCSLTEKEAGVVIGENLFTAVRGGVAVSLEVSFP
jgi:hypothetical protein